MRGTGEEANNTVGTKTLLEKLGCNKDSFPEGVESTEKFLKAWKIRLHQQQQHQQQKIREKEKNKEQNRRNEEPFLN